MGANAKDRTILRDLAKRLAEHAAQPRNAELRQMWLRHNRLEKVKPMVLVSPEGAWNEIVPLESMEAQDPKMQRLERELRIRLYHAEHFHDDGITDGVIRVPLAWSGQDWGMKPARIASAQARGASAYDPPLKQPEDIKKLHFPEFTIDEETTRREFEKVQELLGDLLRVQINRSLLGWNCNLAMLLANLRGLDQVMWDMCDRPEWVHEIMDFLAEGYCDFFDRIEALGAVELNNTNESVYSGGTRLTDELPAEGYQGRPRLRDVWGNADAQEFAQVSPAMLEEFVLPYQARLLGRFGLNAYGCCEPMDGRLGAIKKWIPRLRRVSVSPWSDRREAAEELQDKYIYSWKPKPSEMVITFDPAQIRRSIAETLEVTQGCVVEMILKDTHTVQHEPQRLATWVDIAQELTGEKCAA